MTLPGFPRSYHVLYVISQALNISTALIFFTLALFGIRVSPWCFLALVPGWLALVAWRLVTRAHFRRNRAYLDALCAELDEQSRALLERLEQEAMH